MIQGEPPPAPGGSVTWDPAKKGVGIVLSNGNLDATKSGVWQSVLASSTKSAGKWQFEVLVVNSGGNQGVGVCDPTNLSAIVGTYLGSSSGAEETIGFLVSQCYYKLSTGSGSSTHGASHSTGSIITVTLDLVAATPRVEFYTAGTLRFGRNLPTGRTWSPAGCLESGATLRLVPVGLTYPVSGYSDWG